MVTTSQPGARTALLDAAERLYAERGLGAVSLREVGVAAGQRNNSAAQYHFGSLAGLLVAVFERRMGPVNAARQAMLDTLDCEGRGTDRAGLVEAMTLPLTDAVVTTPDSCYARFLVQVLASGFVAGSGDETFTRAYREVHHRLVAGLDHLPPALRPVRVDHGVLLVVHALAMWEQSRAAGRPPVDPVVLRADLVDTVGAVLDAPSTYSPTGSSTGSSAGSSAGRAPRSGPTPLDLAC